MKTTIKDVANIVGVSAMAVSSVLHGGGRNVRVSAETAERIRQAAMTLNYRPNTVARSLRTSKTEMVGVVCQHINNISEQNPYYPRLLNGIMSALFPENYTLGLCPKLMQNDAGLQIDDGRFDGILWARPDYSEVDLNLFLNVRVPVVMMHAPPGSAPGIPTFTANNGAALQLVVDHLVSLGHNDISFVIEDVNDPTAEGRARQQAFMDAIEVAKISGDVWHWDERLRTLETRIAEFRNKTALVAFSDTLAGHLLVSLREIGVSVPRDLSVVGFDSSSFCERTHPRLTSVHQPVETMAYDATTHLLSMIKEGKRNGDADQQVSTIYSCSLDVRDSTAPPPNFTQRRKVPNV